MSEPNQRQSITTENRASQLREARSVDPFYFYSIPGALKYDNTGIHDMEVGTQTCTITRKSRVSSEVHSDVVLTQASETDLAEIEAEISEMFATFGIPESNRGAADSADSAGGESKHNEFDVYSWDWDFPKSDINFLDDDVLHLNSQTARGAWKCVWLLNVNHGLSKFSIRHNGSRNHHLLSSACYDDEESLVELRSQLESFVCTE